MGFLLTMTGPGKAMEDSSKQYQARKSLRV